MEKYPDCHALTSVSFHCAIYRQGRWPFERRLHSASRTSGQLRWRTEKSKGQVLRRAISSVKLCRRQCLNAFENKPISANLSSEAKLLKKHNHPPHLSTQTFLSPRLPTTPIRHLATSALQTPISTRTRARTAAPNPIATPNKSLTPPGRTPFLRAARPNGSRTHPK